MKLLPTQFIRTFGRCYEYDSYTMEQALSFVCIDSAVCPCLYKNATTTGKVTRNRKRMSYDFQKCERAR
jgi:hypothetical protein